jgi:hypothetical protein
MRIILLALRDTAAIVAGVVAFGLTWRAVVGAWVQP